MTLGEFVVRARKLLIETSVTPSLDVDILVSHILDKDRSWCKAHPEYALTSQQESRLHSAIQRRYAHEPIAYITGKAHFYGREYRVSADTLQPRPETETMIELLLGSSPLVSSTAVVDVGTGSGCIAITVRLELGTDMPVFASDISSKAIVMAKKNAKKYGADIVIEQGHLLEPLLPKLEGYDRLMILANLPYVPKAHTINASARHEPDVAIFGGYSGLELYEALFLQLDAFADTQICVFTESLPPQHLELIDIASRFGFSVRAKEDLIVVFEG